MSLALSAEAQDLLFREARTANTFTDEPVTDEQIRTPQARQRLVAHMSDGNKAKTGSAPLVAILAADEDYHENLPKTFPHFPGAKDAHAGNPARREIAAFNGALQTGYFILGVRAAGLAAGPMTGFDADAVAKEFFPEGDKRVLAVVNIGKPAPDAWRDRLPRLDYEEVVAEV